MPRPCHELHDLQPPGACHWCDIGRDPDSGYGRAFADRPPPGPCGHLGPPTGELRECPTCLGRVRLKVLACAVYGGCLPSLKVEGLGCCAGCPDYVERADRVNESAHVDHL
jgi:hypothetical protein